MKKRVILITAAVASLLIFTVTALAMPNSITGYEVLKDVMRNHQEYDNGTVHYSVTVKDNDEVLFATEGVMQGDMELEEVYMSGELSDGDVTKAFEVSGNEDMMYFKDVDESTIYAFEPKNFSDYEDHNHGKFDDEYDHEGFGGASEQLFDFIMGDLKNQVSIQSVADGNRKLSLALREDDIPLPINLLVAIAAEEGDQEESCDDLDAYAEIFPFINDFDMDCKDKPDLVEDVKIHAFELSMLINEYDQVLGSEFTLVIEGVDETGEYHEIEVSVKIDVTDKGTTEIGQMDMTGEIIDVDEAELEALGRKFDRH